MMFLLSLRRRLRRLRQSRPGQFRSFAQPHSTTPWQGIDPLEPRILLSATGVEVTVELPTAVSTGPSNIMGATASTIVVSTLADEDDGDLSEGHLSLREALGLSATTTDPAGNSQTAPSGDELEILSSTASISGTLWFDYDADGVRDTGEPGMVGVTVYLDDNDNGTLDWADGNSNDLWDEGEGERWLYSVADNVTTLDVDETGQYHFDGLASGPKIVRTFLPPRMYSQRPGIEPGTSGILTVQNSTLEFHGLDGVVTQTVEVPYPGSDWYSSVRDVTADFEGNLWIYNGVFDPRLTKYDPEKGTFEHWSFPDWFTINNTNYGGVATLGSYVFVSDMNVYGDGREAGIIRFDSRDGSWTRLPGSSYIDVAVGLDGLLYAGVETNSDRSFDIVHVIDPQSMEILRELPEVSGTGLAVDENGIIYTGDLHEISRYTPGGEPLIGIPVDYAGPSNAGIINLEISSDGRLLAVDYEGDLHWSDTTRTTMTKYETDGHAAGWQPGRTGGGRATVLETDESVIEYDFGFVRIRNAPDLSAGSDSGVSNTDDLTNRNNATPDSALIFNINDTQPGDTVYLYADNGTTGPVLVGSAVAASDLTAVTTDGSTELADGIWKFTAMIEDEYGTWPASRPLDVTIDTVSARISVTPLVTEDNTPPLSGTVSEPNVTVQVVVNGQTYTARVTGTNWSVSDNLIEPLTPGLYELTASVTDPAGNIGLDPSSHELEILPPTASISGTVWNDADGDGTNNGESGFADVTVYLDQNDNRILDSGEPFTVAAADGSYSFMDLTPGQYIVRQVVPTGYEQTYPLLGSGTKRVSVAADGTQSNGYSYLNSISGDGRYVSFMSVASNLIPDDTNGAADIFVYDQQTGEIERVSVAADGTQGNDSSSFPSISSDGRYISFISSATNLVPGDTNLKLDIFVYDRLTGGIERVSIADDGTQGNNDCYYQSISDDGRYVSFESYASNLVPDDTNGTDDIFVYDRQTNQIERVSVAADGTQANAWSTSPSISGDGRYISFYSEASNLFPGDTIGTWDVFVYDRQTRELERISEVADDTQGNNEYWPASLSDDGRYISFESFSSNLVPDDTNGKADVFVYDRQTDTFELVSKASDGTPGNNDSHNPTLSSDGRYVSFESNARNLVPGGTYFQPNVYVYDRQTDAIELVNVAADGTQGNGGGYNPTLSSNGRYVSFMSIASNLVPDDTNFDLDIFVYDRFGSDAQDITLTAGQTLTDINFGNHQTTAQIDGSVWNDLDGDGVNNGELALSDITVWLDLNSDGDLEAGEPTAITDTNGNYSFTDVDPGTYQIRVDAPTGWEQTYPANSSPQTVTLVAGEIITDITFGLHALPGEIHGTVWHDADGDGTNNGESGFSDAIVWLDLDTDGELDPGEPTAITDATGNYTFTNVEAGTYELRLDVPDGWQQTHPVGGAAQTVVINPGQTITNVTFGLYALPGEIHGTVWNDADGDGTNNGEMGFADVTVYLDQNDNRILDSDEAFTIAAADGSYSFTGLKPGNYIVRQVVPTGHEQTYPIGGGRIEIVSLAADGTQGNDLSTSPSISGDGRYISFSSNASNLVPGDTNGKEDIFVYDRQTGDIERVSVAADGTQGNDLSISPSISDDGRYVSFESQASNLVPEDTNFGADIFVYDRQTGGIERVNVAADGTQANTTHEFFDSSSPSISDDGRYVSFDSYASNLVPDDTNGKWDIFVYDRQTGGIERVNIAADGTQASYSSFSPSISGDGRYVSFYSDDINLIPGEIQFGTDIYVYDRQTDGIEQVSVAADGTLANNYSYSGSQAISDDGRYVSFASYADNLIPGDTTWTWDIFVHDRQTGGTERVNVAADGTQANKLSVESSISGDGRYISFKSLASNLVSGDTNETYDVFVYDRQTGGIERVSIANHGVQGNDSSSSPSISDDGRYISFYSYASNLVPNDTNLQADIFVYDRLYGDAHHITITDGQSLTGIDFGIHPLPAQVNGSVWEDFNGNGVNNNEPPLSDATVWLDLNADGELDPDEPSTSTDATGNYTFTDLEAGTYELRLLVPTGWEQTYPTDPGSYSFTLSPGDSQSNLNFGTREIDGKVLHLFEDFTDGVADNFVPVQGTWQVLGGFYRATPAVGEHAVSTLPAMTLPAAFEFDAVLNMRISSDRSSNGLLIFDYVDANNYKYAGAMEGGDKWVIGQKVAGTASTLQQFAEPIASDLDYPVKLIFNGGLVTLQVAGVEKLSHDFGGSLSTHPLGLGTFNAIARFDNIKLTSEAVDPNGPPVIGSLDGTPNALTLGENLTLTASGVTGVVELVEFYRDSNDSGSLEVGVDVLLGSDTVGGDGWNWTGSSSDWSLGLNRFFARASDGDVWSDVVEATVTVNDGVIDPSVLLLEDFADGVANGFTGVQGNWQILGERYQVTPGAGEHAISTLPALTLPAAFEVNVLLNMDAAIPGRASNGLLIFDYVDADNYKYAGAMEGGDKWVIGQKVAGTASTLQQYAEPIAADTDYPVALIINSGLITLQVNGTDKLSHDFGGSLSTHRLGLGTFNAIAGFDDVTVTAQAGEPNEPPIIGSLLAVPDPVVRGNSLTLTASDVSDADAGDGVQIVEFYRDSNGNGQFDADGDQLLGSDNLITDGWTWVGSTQNFSVGTNVLFARAYDGRAWGTPAQTVVEVQSAGGDPDLLLREDFDDGAADGFVPVLGDGQVIGNEYQIEPDPGSHGAVLLPVTPALPEMFRIDLVLNLDAAVTGRASNGLIIFDYVDVNNYKFAGGMEGGNKWIMGEKLDGTVLVAAIYEESIDPGTDYAMTIEFDGPIASLHVNGATKLTHTFSEMLNDGYLGLGTFNAIARYDDLEVTTLASDPNNPPEVVALTAMPSPVTRGENITLTATGVSDPDIDDTVAFVEFYRDSDNDGQLNPAVDALLGTDMQASDGWTWSGSTSAFAAGINRFFARASDGSTFSNVVSALVEVEQTTDPSVLLNENFDDGIADGFQVIKGNWQVLDQTYQSAPPQGQDGLSLLPIEPGTPGLPVLLPETFTYESIMNLDAGIPGRASNGMLIFDYVDPDNFKYAAAFEGGDLWVLGRQVNGQREILASANHPIDDNHDYALRLMIDGQQAALHVDGVAMLSHNYGEALNDGRLGLATFNAITRFDQINILDEVAAGSNAAANFKRGTGVDEWISII